MTKGFENGTIVPIASNRLRSVSSMERHSQHEERSYHARIYPLSRDGVMMSTQNWKAYLDNRRREWASRMQSKAQAQLEYLRQRRANVTGVTNEKEQ